MIWLMVIGTNLIAIFSTVGLKINVLSRIVKINKHIIIIIKIIKVKRKIAILWGLVNPNLEWSNNVEDIVSSNNKITNGNNML